ncbi:MAG: hypothetical protein SFT94_03535 [Pseudanabaenaceae cyanobacterium bins.68]|nr:hypothetical protein [Pseudanabaenaceae cyanobacterium bins.68]
MNSFDASITFEQAIALTQTLLTQPPLEFGGQVRALLQTANGARGFFVTYLTQAWEIDPDQEAEIVAALQLYPQAELLVKNLAMSTAMAIAHSRNGNLEQAAGSEQVQQRTRKLIAHLQTPELQIIAQQMAESALGNDLTYADFLQKWGYDPEQRQAIAAALDQLWAN